MISEIFILHYESGVPLLHINLNNNHAEDSSNTVLFSGVLQSIRLFLKECKIGELADFTTNNKRIEIHCETHIVVAVIADIDNPTEKIVEMITQDIAAMFLSQYNHLFEKFSGDVTPFHSFQTEIETYMSMITEDIAFQDEDNNRNFEKSKENINFVDWLKNRYDLSSIVQQNAKICIPDEPKPLKIDYILEGGDRPMNALDRWMTKRSFKSGSKLVIFVFILDATHGAAQIANILKQIECLGDPIYTNIDNIYQFFPYEILFCGPTVSKESFKNISKRIINYKSNKIITPKYADHFHREHSPHHEFYRCRISGWEWNLEEIKIQNIPKKVFP